MKTTFHFIQTSTEIETPIFENEMTSQVLTSQGQNGGIFKKAVGFTRYVITVK